MQYGRGFASDGRSPVDEGAEYVEKQGSKAEDRGFYEHEMGAPEGPNVAARNGG
jgi:hypothetical protein